MAARGPAGLAAASGLDRLWHTAYSPIMGCYFMATPSRRLFVDQFFVGWVYGPWVVASLLVILALRLLVEEDFALRSNAWGLFGNASICFSIGCVCKLTWAMARHNAVRQLEMQLRRELGLR